MAHSTQQVGDKVEHVRDLDLIALVGLANDEVLSRPDDHRAIAPWMTTWMRDLEGAGPGCIDLQLDELTSSAVARSELTLLLARVDERIRGFGETVPAQVLNAGCRAPGVVFFDYPVSALTSAIRGLQGLIKISAA